MTTTIIGICPFCGKETSVSMTYEQFIEYQYGNKNVQDIFPEKSATEREILISGMCNKCQKETFGF